jgi:hypothetical protein
MLMQHSSAGVAWVMHAAPRLGWLLAAGEALHCGAGIGGSGARAQLQRSAVAAVLKVHHTLRSVAFVPIARGIHHQRNDIVSANFEGFEMSVIPGWSIALTSCMALDKSQLNITRSLLALLII